MMQLPLLSRLLAFPFCFLLTLMGVAKGQTPACPCEPNPSVKTALDGLSSEDYEALPYNERRARRLSALTDLQRQYPRDLFIEQRYQDESRTRAGLSPKLIEKYRKLMEEHRTDPLYPYLYARVLVGTRTREAISIFEKALESSPGFVWPHLPLARLYGWTTFADDSKVVPHLEAFIASCPNTLQPYSYLDRVTDQVFLKTAASRLRKRLRDDTNRDSVPYYEALWKPEFRIVPLAVRHCNIQTAPSSRHHHTGVNFITSGYSREMTGNETYEDFPAL
jgi:hypothetical protein